MEAPLQEHLTNSDNSFLLRRLTAEISSPYYDHWVVEYDYSSIDLDRFKDKSLPWFERYQEVLPFKELSSFKSLGEGNTPLVSSKIYPNCFFKEETRNPSGCFKDRESAALIPYLIEKKLSHYALASSGNGALSSSLYARLYGAKVTCFVPTSTSQSKKDLIRTFGGEIKELGEHYEDCHRTLVDQTTEDSPINISAGVHPLRGQGDKVIAYELWDSMGVPDYILVPSANGCLISAIYQGFLELKILNLIDRLPILIAVQIENAAPLQKALRQGKKDYSIIETVEDSLAEGLVAMESFNSPNALHALRQTNGFVHSVSESSLIDGMRYAIEIEGLFPEWTSATVFSALRNLYDSKKIPLEATTVVINSGSGHKEVANIANKISVKSMPSA
jgi:threonine synthase